MRMTSTASDNKQSRITISERRATYPFQERLKIYNPDTMARRISEQEKNQGKMIVNGVNLLNKTSLDSDTMMHRIKQRRETHNRVERRRRDKLNNLVSELAHSIPLDVANAEKCHRAKILRHAIDYIQLIQQENNALRIQLGQPVHPFPSPSSQGAISPSSSETDTNSDSDSHTNRDAKPPVKSTHSPAFDTFCFQI
ncbi:hypothetical protein BC941DRAFT_2746 [Chlamydoabsidia padenii]|nr:hypothetical protein BC941DRAFT_2746 [Chlamydoabsidia padenii]